MDRHTTVVNTENPKHPTIWRKSIKASASHTTIHILFRTLGRGGCFFDITFSKRLDFSCRVFLFYFWFKFHNFPSPSKYSTDFYLFQFGCFGCVSKKKKVNLLKKKEKEIYKTTTQENISEFWSFCHFDLMFRW